jgi:SOS-response transcriptional repressor LexA
MNRGPEPGHASSKPRFTQKQGQYLAFIHAYTLVLGRPPAEADLRRHFRVTPPSVHQMLITLEREGLIRRQPGIARSIQLLIDPSTLPPLLPQPTSISQNRCARVLGRVLKAALSFQIYEHLSPAAARRA